MAGRAIIRGESLSGKRLFKGEQCLRLLHRRYIILIVGLAMARTCSHATERTWWALSPGRMAYPWRDATRQKDAIQLTGRRESEIDSKSSDVPLGEMAPRIHTGANALRNHSTQPWNSGEADACRTQILLPRFLSARAMTLNVLLLVAALKWAADGGPVPVLRRGSHSWLRRFAHAQRRLIASVIPPAWSWQRGREPNGVPLQGRVAVR